MRKVTVILIVFVGVELLIAGALLVRKSFQRTPLLPQTLSDDPLFASQLQILADEAQQKGNADQWLELGQALLSHGYYDHAELAFRHAAAVAPGSQEAHFGLAFCLDRTGRMAESEPEYRRAIELNDRPNAPNKLTQYAWSAIGRNLLREEKADEAEAVFRKTARIQAHSLQLAKLMIRSGRAAEALPVIEEGLKQYPQSLEFRVLKYEAFKALNRPEDAEKVADQLERVKSSVTLNFNTDFVSAYRKRAGFDKAIEDYNRLVPTNDFDRIAAQLQKLIDEIGDLQVPVYRIARVRMSEVEMQRHKPEKIHQMVDELHAKGIADPDLLQFEGAALSMENQPGQAAELWLRAAKMAPNAGLDRELVKYFTQKGDLQQRDFFLADEAMLNGQQLYWGNQVADALPYLQKSVELNPQNAKAWFYLGQVQRVLGHQAEALNAYERCAAIDPMHGRALREIAELKKKA
ncbi:tetratricopeptide repeat protein [Planctomicrobium piriforme]|uniref:Tetratricopeptide repeat-containing protein n=1 Tax=Planctomicrobium piriforme TaxID=1576369 RepID=A0A1I3GJX6_9PLAN|nr:tetratricopeptide repeat protein [Planctomicrobium piriforme]SFI23723.1 Tetratricopeptide repeat-containing protein [Planctomicrobium piriforme]